MHGGVRGRCRGKDAGPSERSPDARSGGAEPELLESLAMIQVTPQMRVVVAIEPADFRRGIDGLARLCKEVLKHDPFNGWVFVFRNRAATAVKILVYDGQGYWLCHKRLSSGKFSWWPSAEECGGQNAGSPSVAGSSFGGQSGSDASGACLAIGGAGGLTRRLAAVPAKSRQIALSTLCGCALFCARLK